MEEEVFPFVMKIFVLLTTPVTLFIGIFLLFDFNTYLKIEKFLSKTYFVSKDLWIDRLGKSKLFVHSFLISHRRGLGIICIFNTIAMILANIFLFKKN